jgi:hypothetical protein
MTPWARLCLCCGAWLAAFLAPLALGYSVRAAALACVLVMALSAVPVLLAVEDLTKGRLH